jgi:hypothetical protein
MLANDTSQQSQSGKFSHPSNDGPLSSSVEACKLRLIRTVPSEVIRESNSPLFAFLSNPRLTVLGVMVDLKMDPMREH